MAEHVPEPLSRWKYGFHPLATELRVRSLGRVHIRLGEALRLEMVSPNPADEHTVHLQYYIATELGPWALWLTSEQDDLEACEAPLRDITTPFSES